MHSVILRQASVLIECFEGKSFQVGLATQAHPDHADENQDCALMIEDPDGNLIIAIADGFGGAPRGSDASRLCMEALARSVSAYKTITVSEQVISAFDAANIAVRSLKCGSASTLVCAWLSNSAHARVCHAGDSFAAIIGRGGKLKYRALEHSPGAYATEAGISARSIASELAGEEQSVLNFVGAEHMSVEVGPELELSPFDTIVVASDGLTDNLSLNSILELCRSGPVEQCAADLLSVALKRYSSHPTESKPDDITVLVCRRRMSEEM